MDVRRSWFLAALAVFFVWVAALALLAATASRKPPSSAPSLAVPPRAERLRGY